MTEAEAIARVTRDADANVFPCLTTQEVTDIVRDNVRATIWAASTDYAYGTVVRPTVFNGSFYLCTTAGTSKATEPNWNTALSSTTVDNTVVWQEFRTDPDGNLYDLRSAIGEAWELKAAKAAGKTDVTIGDMTFKDSQVYEHCRQMAQMWAPIEF